MSLRNFLRRAASWTGFSSVRLTVEGSRSSASHMSLSRRMFPFFLKIPSTDMSAREKEDLNQYLSKRTGKIERTRCSPICFIAAMMSSTKVGTLR